MMNSILNIFGYSEDIILGNYHLRLDPANASAWQQLTPSSLILFTWAICVSEISSFQSQKAILPPPDLLLYTGWRTYLVQRHLYQVDGFVTGEEA